MSRKDVLPFAGRAMEADERAASGLFFELVLVYGCAESLAEVEATARAERRAGGMA